MRISKSNLGLHPYMSIETFNRFLRNRIVEKLVEGWSEDANREDMKDPGQRGNGLSSPSRLLNM